MTVRLLWFPGLDTTRPGMTFVLRLWGRWGIWWLGWMSGCLCGRRSLVFLGLLGLLILGSCPGLPVLMRLSWLSLSGWRVGLLLVLVRWLMLLRRFMLRRLVSFLGL